MLTTKETADPMLKQVDQLRAFNERTWGEDEHLELYLEDEDEEEMNNLSSTSSTKAQLEIEIIDPRNEQKFESLAAKDEKLKTTYKRKHSGDLDTPTKRANDRCGDSGDDNDDGDDDGKEDGELDDSRLTSGGSGNVGGSLAAGRPRYFKTNQHRPPSECSEATTASSSRQSKASTVEYETDPEVLSRRQKQIDFGKNTVGYDNYVRQVPKNRRQKDHPRTPTMQLKYSRRAWDGLIKVWRRKLHDFDDKKEDEEEGDGADDDQKEQEEEGKKTPSSEE